MKEKSKRTLLKIILVIFTISLLTSCKTAKTTETLQASRVRSEIKKETEQTEKDNSNIYAHIDSLIVEEYEPEKIENTQKKKSTSIHKDRFTKPKRTIKVYGINNHQQISRQSSAIVKEQAKVDSTASQKQMQKETVFLVHSLV